MTEKIKNLLAWLPLTAFVIYLGFICNPSKHQKDLTPREKNGIDTVYTADSAYVIKFKIDSVFEVKDNEPMPDPRT